MKHKQKCILLVDDNPINLQIGINVLLDVKMPGINGFDAIQILKSRDKSKNIPVIFLTSNSGTEDINMGMSLGAVDYIIKP